MTQTNSTNRRVRIEQLESQVAGLKNDARYWDLRRTYGDHSREVLGHLESCARAKAVRS